MPKTNVATTTVSGGKKTRPFGTKSHQKKKGQSPKAVNPRGNFGWIEIDFGEADKLLATFVLLIRIPSEVERSESGGRREPHSPPPQADMSILYEAAEGASIAGKRRFEHTQK